LKYNHIETKVNAAKSRPSRGAWIEIESAIHSAEAPVSRPSRGAWIEIFSSSDLGLVVIVAPLAGRVD